MGHRTFAYECFEKVNTQIKVYLRYLMTAIFLTNSSVCLHIYYTYSYTGSIKLQRVNTTIIYNNDKTNECKFISTTSATIAPGNAHALVPF
jgi:hypothetical protein